MLRLDAIRLLLQPRQPVLLLLASHVVLHVVVSTGLGWRVVPHRVARRGSGSAHGSEPVERPFAYCHGGVTAMPDVGWYPDPFRRFQQRYWDGTTWTADVSSDGLRGTDAPTPPPPPTAGERVSGPPPAPAAARPELEETSSRWSFRIFGIVLVLAVGGVIAYSTTRNSTGTSGSASSTAEVVFEVTGTAKTTDITYSVGGRVAQQSGVDVPLVTKSTQAAGLHISAVPRGAFVQLSAQNGGDSGNITCAISVDGVVVDTNTSFGGFTIASCQAKV